VKLEDSLGVHWGIGKAIHRAEIRLDEPRDWEAPLVAGANAATARSYVRGPELDCWHLGQK